MIVSFARGLLCTLMEGLCVREQLLVSLSMDALPLPLPRPVLLVPCSERLNTRRKIEDVKLNFFYLLRAII